MKHKRDSRNRDPIEKIVDDVFEDEDNEFITGVVPKPEVVVEPEIVTPQPESSTSQTQARRKSQAHIRRKRKKSIHSLLNVVQEEAVLSDCSSSSSSETEGNRAQDDAMLSDDSNFDD